MATTLPQPPKIDERRDPSRPSDGSGTGGPRTPVSTDGKLPAVKEYSPPPASTGIWVALASIAMTFAAFTSALIVRQSALDWHHLVLPRILYLNTVLLFGSSFALEVARRRMGFLKGGLKNQDASQARWLYVALFLGMLFVVGQYVAWAQLRSQGLYLATNPNSSFFYVLTAIHALHVLGGLGGLVRVIYRLNASILRKSTLDATAYYWHFMDALWVYLLVLLWMRL
jgi:cytochrome c oxidase subunit III